MLRIKGLRVTVSKYDCEADYSADVLATFERFKQGAAKDYRIGFHNPPEMGHVEANILGLVARLFPGFFLRWTTTAFAIATTLTPRSGPSTARCTST